MKVGFIGLGAMGKPMAKRLLAVSHELFVYDRNKDSVTELEALGATGCDNPAGVAAQADVTLMSLPNSTIVSQVVMAEDGLLSTASAGNIIIDLSSVDPGCSRKLAAAAAEKEVGYVDAPVSGGVAGAAAGSLTIMAGGSEYTIERVRHLLDQLGSKVVHIGDVGAGDAIKIVNNMILGANMAVLAEALVLGKKLGLSGETMSEIIGQGSGKSYVLDAKLDKFIRAGNFNPGFAIDLQHKDLGLAMDAAKDAGVPVPMGSLATQLYEMAKAKGMGNKDMSAVIRIWEDLVGVEVRD